MTTRRVAELEYRTPNAETVKRRLDELGAAGERANNRLARGADAARRQTSLAAQAQQGFSGSLRRTAQSVAVLDGPLGGIASRFSSLASLAGGTGLALGGLALGATAAGAAIGKAVAAASEFERSTFKIEQLLVTTGNASGRTAEQIEELAQSIGRGTLASTNGVRQAAAQLLTFRSIAGETFDETMRLAQDLAAVGFGSIETAAVQLAKALEDPQQGLTSLRRVGVSFTAAQREQILAMREAGDVAGAQAAILAVLRQQVGGAGAAEAGGLAGAYDTLSENVGIFLENIGDAGPVQAAAASLNVLAEAVRRLNDGLFAVEPIDQRIVAAVRERAAAEKELTRLRERESDRSSTGQRFLAHAEARAVALREEEERLVGIARAEADAVRVAEEAAERQGQTIAADIEAERKRAEAKARSEATAKAAAAAAKQLAAERERQVRKVADTIAGLETENAQLVRLAEAYGEGAEAVERVNDTIAVQNALLAAGVSIKEGDGRAIAEMVVRNRELERSVDDLKRAEEEKQRAAKKAAEEQRRTIEKAAEEQRRIVERSTDDVVRYAGDAFADLFEDTGRGWRGMWDDMASWARRALARLAAEMVLRPIIQPVIAGAMGVGGAGGISGAGVGGIAGVGPSGSGIGGSGTSDLFGLGRMLGNVGGVSNWLNSSVGTSLGFSSGLPMAAPSASFVGPMPLAQGSMFGSTTLTGFLGGAGAGFGAGMLLNDLLGGSQLGGTIGSGGGALAGAAIGSIVPGIGTLLGGVLGGLIGGGLGGLFGKKKPSVGPAIEGTVSFDQDGSILETRTRTDNDGDIEAARAAMEAVRDSVEYLRQFGELTTGLVLDIRGTARHGFETRLQGELIAGRGSGDTGKIEDGGEALVIGLREAINRGIIDVGTEAGIAAANSAAKAVEDFLGDVEFGARFQDQIGALKVATLDFGETIAGQVKAEIESTTAALREFNDRTRELGLDTNAAMAATREFVEVFIGLRDAAEPLSETQAALAALNARFENLNELIELTGLGVDAIGGQDVIDEARRQSMESLVEGFDDANRRAILSITDPMALALDEFDRVARQRLEDVAALGADTVLVERRNMLERQKIVEQFAAETAAAVSNLPRVLEGLTGFAGELQLGALSALSPDERYRVASSQFADISSRAATGELAALRGFEGVARSFLEVSRARYGSTATYAGDFGRVVSALDKLSAQPQTNWQRLDTTIAEGNSESARLLRSLIDEVKRLRAEVRQAGTIRPARVA